MRAIPTLNASGSLLNVPRHDRHLRHVIAQHEGRVEGQDDQSFVFGRLDQPLDHLQHRRVMVEVEEGQRGPVLRLVNLRLLREGQLKLILTKSMPV
jgi:hypothetical protein